jgi:hypothetical protein
VARGIEPPTYRFSGVHTLALCGSLETKGDSAIWVKRIRDKRQFVSRALERAVGIAPMLHPKDHHLPRLLVYAIQDSVGAPAS